MQNKRIQALQAMLNTYSLTPNKALGQNFLVDADAIDRILDAAAVEGKGVLEIGAGAGALTEGLLARARAVAAVEIDAHMADILRDRFGDALLLYREDFLKTDLAALHQALGGEAIYVVGNLPYYVTTPICMRLLSCALPIGRMTLMVQQEAAARFFAQPCERVYGPMAVLSQAYYTPSRVLALSPESYYPRPDVYSEVVTLSRNARAYQANLAPLVKTCFAMRRKTIANNLKAYSGKQPVEKALAACKISPSARAEALAPEQFLSLSEQL
ncbi:MAG: 16S rRNA (adenine(1518)-N(6)/adenine(1519)-N(6))-dimethyltransferase RsmA [Clostridia bacterium]|nr:16S rRNA (adenine(1518)-N(6)/adenine(1519)-N(6))-dimethyltransferase RsmA [Clostridia bacterium]